MNDYWHFNPTQQCDWAMDSLSELHGKYIYIVNQASGSCCVVRQVRYTCYFTHVTAANLFC